MGTDRFEKHSLTKYGTGMKFATRTNVSSVTDETSSDPGYTHTITIARLDSDMNQVENGGTLSGGNFNISERIDVKSNAFHDESAKEGALYDNHPWIV